MRDDGGEAAQAGAIGRHDGPRGNPGVVDMFRAVVPAQGRRFTDLDLVAKGGLRTFADTPLRKGCGLRSPSSLVPLQLPLAPMRLFSIWIEHATCRFRARSTPIRACIRGPRFSAVMISACAATCHCRAY
jgi:hypothetical protein